MGMINYLKNNLSFWKLATLFVFIVMTILAIIEIMSGKKDGIYEQATEDMIEHATGISLDLTPEN